MNLATILTLFLTVAGSATAAKDDDAPKLRKDIVRLRQDGDKPKGAVPKNEQEWGRKMRNKTLAKKRHRGLEDVAMSMQCQGVETSFEMATNRVENAKKVVDQAWDNVSKAVDRGMKKGCTVGVTGEMKDLNTLLSAFNYDDVSWIKTAFESIGYTLVATPKFRNLAQNLRGTTGGINALGQFDIDEFDCSGGKIALTDGFGSDLDGHPYMLFAGFGPGGLAGTAAQIYRDYDTEVELKDLFYPGEQKRNLYAYVRNVDGTEVVDDSGTTSTEFSEDQDPTPNGYYRTNKFSRDDGVWGFRIGSSVNGDGGPYLENDAANSYGCENSNGSDGSPDSRKFYWGGRTNTQNYAFYFAIKKATACVAPATQDEPDV